MVRVSPSFKDLPQRSPFESLKLSKKQLEILEVAFKEAQKSTMQFKHGAVLVQGNRILGTCHNYSSKKKSFHGPTPFSMHAEVGALMKTIFHSRKQIKKNRGLIRLYVIRVTNAGKVLNSKPCSNCQRMMKKFGVDCVYYST